jgi:hypothetical protein
MEPMLIFDKSFLESLNPDEAVWLDNFFSTCVTPLFFIETLADLEKEVRRGRTSEQVVGSLAYKTPDMKSHVSPLHTRMLLSELRGEQDIAMDARIKRSDDTVVQLNDQQGVIYKASKEEEAFVRWQRGEFLDLERQIAKEWRKAVSGIDYSQSYDSFKKLYGNFRRPKNLKDAKDIAETLIDLLDEEVSMRFGMTLLQVPSDVQSAAVARWSIRGRQPLREFAPYFLHMYVVDLFYYLAIGADLISRVRPAGKADNKVDIAYLYYVPFCEVFASNDNLHDRVVPTFLRADQTFVKGPQVNSALREAELGNTSGAKHGVTAALALSSGRDVKLFAAFTLARIGDVPRAKALAAELEKSYPTDTIMKLYWLPTINAAIELNLGSPSRALANLEAAAPYELGEAGTIINYLYPAYVRGQAYLLSHNGTAAAAEFQKLLDHRGIVGNFVTGSLAHLQVGRAYAMAGDIAKAKAAYQDFFTLWKDADSDLPILKQSKAEYASCNSLESFLRFLPLRFEAD